MRVVAMFAAGLALAVGGVLTSAAQPSPAAAGRNYDPSTVETIKGRIMSIDHVSSPGRGRSGGVHMTIETGKEKVAVHLGPAWYVDAHPPRLESGDEVEVEGSRVSIDGQRALVAREVRKDGQVLTLRNAAGVPAWAGYGGGRREGRPRR